MFEKLNPEHYSIEKFIKFVSKKVKPTEIVLDTGAGSCPYKKYFAHANYESTDFKPTINKLQKVEHTFYCSLDNIPKKDNSYDVIINTQVLEHVEYPQKVLNELFRILKPGGKLFLTAPQGWAIHEAPNNFFNFTKYGLKSLFEHAGFNIVFIKPRGGIFWYLADRLREFFPHILKQYLFEEEYNKQRKFKPKFLSIFLAPLYLLSYPFTRYIIPWAFFYLDKLDKKRDFTLGYACYCIKPREGK